MAVGQKYVPKNGTLVNGHLDYNLRSPAGLILTHSQTAVEFVQGRGAASAAACVAID